VWRAAKPIAWAVSELPTIRTPYRRDTNAAGFWLVA
jgi:hypothetical protein